MLPLLMPHASTAISTASPDVVLLLLNLLLLLLLLLAAALVGHEGEEALVGEPGEERIHEPVVLVLLPFIHPLGSRRNETQNG
jgi:regulator of protease activity HflC (stomatin/prohibitin superfamily)